MVWRSSRCYGESGVAQRRGILLADNGEPKWRSVHPAALKRLADWDWKVVAGSHEGKLVM